MKFFLFFALLGICGGSAEAASGGTDFFAELFAPGMIPGTRIKLEQHQFAKEYAAGSTFGQAQTRFDSSVPISSGETGTWRANAFSEYDAIESSATFSNGRQMPNRLWDVGAGISNSRNLDDGRSAGGNFSVSSPADRPFGAGRDLGFNLNLTYKIPQPDGNAWILFLGASNTRGFLNYIPLPGAAYFFKSGKKLRGLVGVPFLMIFWLPTDPWTISAFYFPLRTGELKVSYGSPRGFQPYALLNYHTRNYRLFDRTNEKERLYFEEAIAQAGLNVPIAKGVLLDLAGGLGFARRFFLAEKATDRTDTPRISPDNALFASAKISAFF